MDRLQALLGFSCEKRIYHIDEAALNESEFQAARTMWDVIFGKDGLVENLGPTWNMVHDPRFTDIEEAFIINRASVFGGDASTGRINVASIGQIDTRSTYGSLEEYATILGEGRHFLKCAVAKGWDVRALKDDYHKKWQLIRQECPNYFDRKGDPNRLAKTLYSLLSKDIIGLILDYAEVPLSVDWINAETMEVVENPNAFWQESEGDALVVAVEVDTLEKALMYRAQCRLTAYKFLKQSNIDSMIEKAELLDHEVDELLKEIFRCEFNELYKIAPKLAAMINGFNSRPKEVRQVEHLENLKIASAEICGKLKSGEMQPIKTVIVEEHLPMSEEDQAAYRILTEPSRKALLFLSVKLDQWGKHVMAEELVSVIRSHEPITDEVYNDWFKKAEGALGTDVVTTINVEMEEGVLQPVKEDV